MKRSITIATLLILMQLFSGAAQVLATEKEDSRILIDKARITLVDFTTNKNNAFLQENLKKAKGMLIFPQVLKAGFLWGGGGGTGILSVRDEKTGEWSQPVFYTIGSISFGLQIGVQTAEIVILAMNQKAVDTLYSSSFKLGGDATVAAGPYGMGITKDLTANFLAFSLSKGLYAGLDLEGAGLAVRGDLNSAYYGREVRPLEVIVKKEVSNPASTPLLAALRNR